MEKRIIRTTHVNPSIPNRNFDWQAVYADDEEGLCGFGRTQDLAIQDLEEKEYEQDAEAS